jgi:hypothetical protein
LNAPTRGLRPLPDRAAEETCSGIPLLIWVALAVALALTLALAVTLLRMRRRIALAAG